MVVPLVIRALGGGIGQAMREMGKLLESELAKQTVAEMQKTILMDSEGIIRKVLSGLVQSESKDE